MLGEVKKNVRQKATMVFREVIFLFVICYLSDGILMARDYKFWNSSILLGYLICYIIYSTASNDDIC